MLAVMPMASLIFGGLSLAGAALCLVVFLYVRWETFLLLEILIMGINFLFDKSSKFEDVNNFRKKKSSTVTPAFVKSEKVDMSIDLRSKTLR